MTRLRLTAFCLAILTLAGCSQATTDPAKTAVDKPGTQSQTPTSYTPFDRGGDGGGGGY